MRKTRGGWGETGPVATAPFPESCASYFRFTRFNTFPLYYLRARHRLAGNTHIGRKEKPEIMLQFYLKRLYVLLYLDYNCLCLWLSMPARMEMDCNLKTGPTFSSLTPVCRHVVTNYMNNHFYVS